MFSSQTYEDRDLEPITRVYEECHHGDFPEGDGRDDCVICNPVWTEEPSGHSEPNPILLALRKHPEDLRDWGVGMYLDALGYDHRAPELHREVVRSALPEAREHARKVLTRLAALEGAVA